MPCTFNKIPCSRTSVEPAVFALNRLSVVRIPKLVALFITAEISPSLSGQPAFTNSLRARAKASKLDAKGLASAAPPEAKRALTLASRAKSASIALVSLRIACLIKSPYTVS